MEWLLEGAAWLRVALLAAVLVATQISEGRGQQTTPSGEIRTWTSADGRVMQAKLLGLSGIVVQFELPTGQRASVPLARLSQQDQDFIKAQAVSHSLTPLPPGNSLNGSDLPVERRTWPDYVEIDPHALDIKTVETVPSERRYVYRSESFQFISQDKLADSVIKDVARVFEATRALVRALPWGINPHPPTDLGYYVAKLYETRKDYIDAGGPSNSGGVYFSRDRVFMIPFPSLGLEMRGKTWFKKPGFKEETLVHEVTHQMMHDYLPFLPIWVIEGTAEYTRCVPYNYGRFAVKDHERGLREYLKERNSMGSLRPFSEQMTMKRGQWNSLAMAPGPQHTLYFQSYLLVYYFCHLDGDGKGTRFLHYLDAVSQANGSWEKFFQDPRVNRRADGSFTYPTSLTLPPATRTEEFGLEKLEILLGGRSLSQLDADIIAAYKKLGIKLN